MKGDKRKNPITKSFGYAFEGIWTGIKKERNMKIHCVAAIIVTAAGTFFQISAMEWCICLLLFGMVVSLELVNTAVEAVVDLVTEERKPLAKIAKDTAAGAVLFTAIGDTDKIIYGSMIDRKEQNGYGRKEERYSSY